VTQGPNVKRLIVHRMSSLLVPPGGGVGGVVASLMAPGNLARVAREATAWVEEAIRVLRTSPDCPEGDDEHLAGLILAKIEERHRAQHRTPR
jgi:hypothetical protein